MTTPIMAPSDHNFVLVLALLTMFHEIHCSSSSGLVIGCVHGRIIIIIDKAFRGDIIEVVVVVSDNTAAISVHCLRVDARTDITSV